MFASLFQDKQAKAAAKPSEKNAAKAPPRPTAAVPGPSGGLSKKQRKKQRQQAEAAAAVAVGGLEDQKKKNKKKEKTQKQPNTSAGASAAATMPATTSTHEAGGGSVLQRKMAAQLAGAQFRRINEELYTTHSSDAVALFKEQPRLFELYHVGFRSQAAHWPQRPVEVLAQWLKAKPDSWVVADMGCGDAELAASVRQKVHSYDLVANNPRVVACDVANVPLASGTLDAVVFCLALMGTNHDDFLREAHRLLRPRGVLKIAEVSSRFDDLAAWLAMLHALGFDLVSRDESNTHFVLLEFVKSSSRPCPAAGKYRAVQLKPCIYKRR